MKVEGETKIVAMAKAIKEEDEGEDEEDGAQVKL